MKFVERGFALIQATFYDDRVTTTRCINTAGKVSERTLITRLAVPLQPSFFRRDRQAARIIASNDVLLSECHFQSKSFPKRRGETVGRRGYARSMTRRRDERHLEDAYLRFGPSGPARVSINNERERQVGED